MRMANAQSFINYTELLIKAFFNRTLYVDFYVRKFKLSTIKELIFILGGGTLLPLSYCSCLQMGVLFLPQVQGRLIFNCIL